MAALAEIMRTIGACLETASKIDKLQQQRTPITPHNAIPTPAENASRLCFLAQTILRSITIVIDPRIYGILTPFCQAILFVSDCELM